MNNLPDFFSTYQNLKQTYQTCKDVSHLTDLKVFDHKGTLIVTSYWYTKLPFLGHVISFIRFNYYGESLIKQKIESVQHDHQMKVIFTISQLIKGKIENNIENIHCLDGYQELILQFTHDFGLKNLDLLSASSLKNRTVQEINTYLSNSTLSDLKQTLNSGILPETNSLITSLIDFVSLVKKVDHFYSKVKEKKEIAKDDFDQFLNESQEIINHYQFLAQMEKDLERFSLDRLPNKFATIKNQITQSYQNYISNPSSLNFIEGLEYQVLFQAIKYFKNQTLIKNYYPDLAKEVELFYPLLSELNFWKNFNSFMQSDTQHLNSQPALENFYDFFEKLIFLNSSSALEALLHIYKYQADKKEIFERLILIIWQKEKTKAKDISPFSACEKILDSKNWTEFQEIVVKYGKIDDPEFIKFKIHYLLQRFTFLKDSSDRLETLKQEISLQKQKNLDLTDPKVGQIQHAIYLLLQESTFSKYYPVLAKNFQSFYKNYPTTHFNDLPQETYYNLFSRLEPSELIQLCRINSNWKALIHCHSIRDLPFFFTNLFELMKEEMNDKFDLALGSSFEEKIKQSLQPIHLNNLEDAHHYIHCNLLTLAEISSALPLLFIKNNFKDLFLRLQNVLFHPLISKKMIEDFQEFSLKWYHFKQLVDYNSKDLDCVRSFFQQLTAFDLAYAIKVVNHLPKKTLHEKRIVELAISAIWQSENNLAKKSNRSPFDTLIHPKEKEIFLKLLFQFPLFDDPDFNLFKMDRILDPFKILQNPHLKLAELMDKIRAHHHLLDHSVSKLDMRKNHKELYSLIEALNSLVFDPFFQTNFPQEHQKIESFYQRATYGYDDLPIKVRLHILSYLPRDTLYKAEVFYKNSVWKQAIERKYCSQVPTVFYELLENIKNQLPQLKKYSQDIYDKLSSMQEETKTQAPLSTLSQVQDYLKNQKNALVFALSLLSPKDLKKIELPCLDSLILGINPAIDDQDCTTCEIHEGLKESIVWNRYNKIMNEGYKYFSDEDAFFKSLSLVEPKSMIKLLLKIYQISESTFSKALEVFYKSYLTELKLNDFYLFFEKIESIDKDSLLEIIIKNIQHLENLEVEDLAHIFKLINLIKDDSIRNSCLLKLITDFYNLEDFPALDPTNKDDQQIEMQNKKLIESYTQKLNPESQVQIFSLKISKMRNMDQKINQVLALTDQKIKNELLVEILKECELEINEDYQYIFTIVPLIDSSYFKDLSLSHAKELEIDPSLCHLEKHEQSYMNHFIKYCTENLLDGSFSNKKKITQLIQHYLFKLEKVDQDILLKFLSVNKNFSLKRRIKWALTINDSKIKDIILCKLLKKCPIENIKDLLVIIENISDKVHHSKDLLDFICDDLLLENASLFIGFIEDEKYKKIAVTLMEEKRNNRSE